MKGELSIPEDVWVDELPEEEGRYLHNDSTWGIQLISVRFYPSTSEYGVFIEAYYGVPQAGGKHVSRLKGKFVRLV